MSHVRTTFWDDYDLLPLDRDDDDARGTIRSYIFKPKPVYNGKMKFSLRWIAHDIMRRTLWSNKDSWPVGVIKHDQWRSIPDKSAILAACCDKNPDGDWDIVRRLDPFKRGLFYYNKNVKTPRPGNGNQTASFLFAVYETENRIVMITEGLWYN